MSIRVNVVQECDARDDPISNAVRLFNLLHQIQMVILFQPAGKMEEFFLTLSSLDHEPTPTEIATFFAASDMEIVGPPLKID